MWWSALLLIPILILAYFIRKAGKGTPFAHRCPCTPYIEHLRGQESSEKQLHKKENLW